ncbi:MFS transporter [Bradyrhizobium prioriisuperbiae]|uniref:MFS transporter n=1 Tax=Bradyrhizobium prioriisuperbiae TaxID=2854389 RepID=UPI0028E72517|nr:MFS transporter [Bradyrhizobium prioritasuperba]
MTAMSSAAASPVSAQNQDWLVGNPTAVQVGAALWIGSVGLLILGLQPVLLGALFNEHRIDLDMLALVVTAEIVAIGIGSAVAAMLFSTRHLRLKSAILLLALAALNTAVSFAETPHAILLVRTLAGVVEGGMVAVSIELIARSRRAERIGGIFIALQTLAQCLLVFGVGKWIIHEAGAVGANTGFLVLAVVSLASIVLAGLVPAEYGEIPKQKGNMDGVLTPRSILALLSIFAFFMFVGAIWAFLEPLGGQNGIDSQTVAFMVSASLAAQVLGALAATWLQAHIGYRAAILVCSLLGLAASVVLGISPTLAQFWGAVLVIGFIWMFVIPFMIGQTVDADSSRNTALLIPAAQLFGAAIGPLAASMFVVGDDARAVPVFSIGAVTASLVLFGLFLIAARRRAVS